MWQISVSPPRFADKKLASLNIESRANRSTTDQLVLHVALWCQRAHDRIKIGSTTYRLSFGFRSGEVVVDPSGGQILNQPRLQILAARFRIRQIKSETVKKIVLVASKISAHIGQCLGFGTVKAAIELKGHLEKRYFDDVKIDGVLYRNVWRVADAGYNFWRVFGIGLNAEDILENRLIGEKPLCHIGVERGKKSVQVDVSFRCDLRDDLWFQVEKAFQSRIISFFFDSRIFWILNCIFKWKPQDCRFDRDKEALIRSKIAKIIVSKAVKSRALDSVARIDGAPITLARQELHADR